ncbi:MAG: hypothetical protein CMG66_00775 [Candidatus Marinimicrobia bacterium]|nr:hypothetical protein [Candidatus Neomarinimicrobiota bacterium]|tara:strand:- start:6450 stop:7022 length:573 start_codon:yes stop_codon:yes gene_type:complete
MSTPKNKYNVGVGNFIKRQIEGSGKTYSTLTFKKIAEHAEKKLLNKEFRRGYREGVILISVDRKLLKRFICPIIKINENTRFESIPKKRRHNEELYISTKALNGTPLEIGGVDLILYRYDVLEETNERETNKYWELIAFHAIPKEIKELPMGPVTMMRNQLELPGGTKGKYSSKQWAEGVRFWQQYALLK